MLTKREIQLEEKKILDKVVTLLDENNIKYSLCGGTLLGAIRHKGFIPWDDDIDIFICRDDYNKLQEILKENNKLDNNIFFHSYELKNLNLPFTKVYNKDIRIEDKRYIDSYENYLWIDIFPVDGLPNNEKECVKLYSKKEKYRILMKFKKMSLSFMFKNKKRFFINIGKLFVKIFFNLLPQSFLTKKIIKLTYKNPYLTSNYAGCLTWGYGPQEKMKKKEFEEYIDVEFEGSIYKSIKNYDLYLTNLYGDYMTLPPEDKRVTHSFEAWRVEENDEEIKK